MMINGIIPINKPLNWTSQDAVNKLRRIYHTKQVGHTGTLDPLATGVLIVLLGNTCKLCDYFVTGIKEYIAIVEFGIKTSSLDLETEIIKEENTLHLNRELLENKLNDFIGEIGQIPPMTSAIKVKGIPLYSLARQGIEIEPKPRKINISNIEILETFYQNNHFNAKIKVKCSHGTYIRSLARDLGESLNTFSTLTYLERTSNHIFNIENCFKLDDIINSDNPEKYIQNNLLLKNIFPYINVKDSEAETLSYGRFVPIEKEDIPLPLLAFHNDELIGICRIKDKLLKPKKIFIKP